VKQARYAVRCMRYAASLFFFASTFRFYSNLYLQPNHMQPCVCSLHNPRVCRAFVIRSTHSHIAHSPSAPAGQLGSWQLREERSLSPRVHCPILRNRHSADPASANRPDDDGVCCLPRQATRAFIVNAELAPCVRPMPRFEVGIAPYATEQRPPGFACEDGEPCIRTDGGAMCGSGNCTAFAGTAATRGTWPSSWPNCDCTLLFKRFRALFASHR
jgi:hypothetical protein